MGRVQTARQGDFLALMEPGPTLSPALRATLMPMMAALLLEAVAAEFGADPDEREADEREADEREADEREADDDQDCV